MKPFYWQGTTNFGDYMNSWLWPNLLDGYLSEDDNIRLIGIGSLLKSSLNYLAGKKVIFGTGSGYGAIPKPEDYKDWDFYFVRGPLTAKCFNLSADKAIVDGAWLISQIDQYKEIPVKKGISFVPHWTSAESGNWKKICDLCNIKYIDPLAELHTVLKEISESEIVVTESLHGAIMADYFRTPWVPVSASPKFLPFKWIDWFMSVGLDTQIGQLPLTDAFEYLYYTQSRKGVSYTTDLTSFSHRDIEFSAEDNAVYTNPGPMYKAKIYLKGQARNTRAAILRGALPYRSLIYPRWNRIHQEKLAEVLIGLSKGQLFLSSDATRKEKIEQLSAVTEKLKSDYNAGIIMK